MDKQKAFFDGAITNLSTISNINHELPI